MNIIPAEEQGIELIYCGGCDSLFYDLHRPNRWELFCPYCGYMLGSFPTSKSQKHSK